MSSYDGFPYVPQNYAEQFIRDIAELSTSNTDMLLSAIRRFFMPDRVRYFVSSSIGFYRGHSAGGFSEEDFQNIIPTAGGEPVIRGQIHPINVVEPVLWIGESVTASS
jgi:hypothetical protein